MKNTGIRPKTDPRFKVLISRIQKYKAKPNATLESVTLTLDELKEVVSGYIPLLAQIFQNNLVIPEFATFCESVKHLFYKLADNYRGKVLFLSLNICLRPPFPHIKSTPWLYFVDQ